MLDAESLKAEIASLERQRARALAALQQIDGALGFARGLLAKCEQEKPAPPAEPAPPA